MCAKKKNDIDIKEAIDLAWLNLGDPDQYVLEDNLKAAPGTEEEYGMYYIRLLKDPDYVAFACKELLNMSILPEQAVILSEFFKRQFPMFLGSRGFGKTTLLGIYSMLRMALTPQATAGGAGVKIVITGASFRQSKLVFDYMETIWENAPRLRSICKMGKNGNGPWRETDKMTMKVGPNWAIAIPIGTGEKIRGLRSNVNLVDEFNSLPLSIYETVISGFGAVAANPIDIVQRVAKNKKMLELGLTQEGEQTFDTQSRNQTILSGTAGYDFEHFADYWRKYKAIIESQGNPEILRMALNGEIPDGFDWREFSIIRVPYALIPEGFMDKQVVARAKATVHSGTFQKEYECIFSKDSLGFFKRSLIESCVASETNVGSPGWPMWCPSVFNPSTKGRLDKKYVIAVDPASEVDNFSIVVLEMYEEHSRIVYCWTTNRKKFNKEKKAQLTKEDDFYAYCARKIRSLMTIFPCEDIAIDAQGGGISVIEALHDKRNMFAGEVQIWPIIDKDKPADTDFESGHHYIYPIQFSNYAWVSEANHGMKKDLEDKTLLFPRFDPMSLELANAEDNARIREFEEQNPGKTISLYETLEDCVLEIEELKDELTSIVVTKTGTGVNNRDRWDTPEYKTQEGKKGRMRKDRYSALLMANMVARQKRQQKSQLVYGFGGLIVDDEKVEVNDNTLYVTAPDWYRETMNQIFYGN